MTMKCQQNPTNFSGFMNMQIPLQINIAPLPPRASAAANEDVNDLSNRIAQVRLNVNLHVNCQCSGHRE